MSSGIVGVVLWGTIILIGFFAIVVARAVSAERRRGPRGHLREPVLKGWDGTTSKDPAKSERPPR